MPHWRAIAAAVTALSPAQGDNGYVQGEKLSMYADSAQTTSSRAAHAQQQTRNMTVQGRAAGKPAGVT